MRRELDFMAVDTGSFVRDPAEERTGELDIARMGRRVGNVLGWDSAR
jgi:hypothetical protein